MLWAWARVRFATCCAYRWVIARRPKRAERAAPYPLTDLLAQCVAASTVVLLAV
jgi:hypothetical protein